MSPYGLKSNAVDLPPGGRIRFFLVLTGVFLAILRPVCGQEVDRVKDSDLLITGVDFTALLDQHLHPARVLGPTITGAGLLYHFEGLKAGGRLSAVVAVYGS